MSSEGSVSADAMQVAGGLAVALMVVASLFLQPSCAASEPLPGENPDLTRYLHWTFDSPGDYVAHNATVQDGVATLEYKNETVVENTSGAYALGSVLENVDVMSYPGSIVLDRTPPAVHELVLQPGPEGVDTYIAENAPNTNYGASVTLSVDSENTRQLRTLIYFDLAPVPSSAVIVNATLHMYLKNSKAPVVAFDIYALSRPFVESEASWNFAALGQRWTNPGGDYYPISFYSGQIPFVEGVHSWDISRLVDLWTTGRLPNYGLIIVPAAAAGDAVKNFYSSDEANRVEFRPKLSVNYTLPPPAGVYESRAIGPGTDSVFTLARWVQGNLSEATDEFAGPGLGPRWHWYDDPALGTGAWDVCATVPGWLHMVGEKNLDLKNATLGTNYLYQDISLGFSASTRLRANFSAAPMGAGILVVQDARNWAGVYLTGARENTNVEVVVAENGVTSTATSIPWGSAEVYLRAVRAGDTLGLWFGPDGRSWTLARSYTPALPFSRLVKVGLSVFSGTSSENPVVDFDYFRVDSNEPALGVQVRARVGNSTSLADPSWGVWGPSLADPEGSVLGLQGRYVQYRVELVSVQEWATPAFSGFVCWYERHAPAGWIETATQAVSHLRRWLTFTASELLNGGAVSYSYSVDHGATWKPLITGVSNALGDSEPFMKLRIALSTPYTLTTPAVEDMLVTYSVSASSFTVSAPASVIAGEPFAVTISAVDELGRTITHWTGTVSLEAMDASGTAPAGSSLSVTSVYVTAGGTVTVPSESYTASGTIRIMAYAEGASGLSAPITVLPGEPASIAIAPPVSSLPEFSQAAFEATVYDAYGNEVPDAPISWASDPALGTLNASEGRWVTLSTGVGRQAGYLTAATGSVSARLYIEVVPPMYAPEFLAPIPAQVKPEDYGTWVLNISSYVSDAEDDLSQLRWYVTNERIVTVSGENKTGNMEIVFSTKKDVFGTSTLTLVVVDSDGMEAATAFEVVITPVNDGPTIDHIAPLVVTGGVDYAYNFRYYVHDIDNPYEELSLMVDSGSIQYTSINWLTIVFNYPESMVGSVSYVVVTVSDGELSSSTVVKVTVSDDKVPLGTNLPDLVMNQGETVRDYFNLENYFDDPDGDVLFYASGNRHVQVVIHTNNSVDFIAPTDWYGVEEVVFIATDPEGARAEQAMTVTVNHVNQPPSIAGVPNLVVRYELRYEFDLGPYIADPDTPKDQLSVSTDDMHIAVLGTVLSMLYPRSMNGTVVPVRITVSDGELSDSVSILVTVSEDYPPVALDLPDHSFLEDVPVAYPVGGHLEEYFLDPDPEGALAFAAFTNSPHVSASVVLLGPEGSVVEFVPEKDFNGVIEMTVRAVEPGGGLAERTVRVNIIPVPDPPRWTGLPEELHIYEGQQIALDLAEFVVDPDLEDTSFAFAAEGEYAEHAEVKGSVLVLMFERFLAAKEASRKIPLGLRVVDPSGLADTATVDIVVMKGETAADQGERFYLAMALGMGSALALGAVLARTRKRPFAISDLMLIHNDGFLIGRYATPKEGEIDEQILSAMLTAVLNFVEDSTGAQGQGLKTFGFEEYQVLVERGQKAFVAVVYEGDPPKDIEKSLQEFLGRVERIYRKKLVDWTGDIETDFAGVEVLIGAFVKEHSRGKAVGRTIWTRGAKRKGGQRKVTVNPVREEQVRRREELSGETKGK